MTGLAGQVALVTGALRGIGLAIAERHLADGAIMWLADLKPADDADVTETLARLGDKARYVPLDVADEAGWEAAEKAVRAKDGRLDILVLNAGIDGTGETATLPLSKWQRVMAVNVDGVFLGTKHFTKLMAESGAGRRGGASIIVMSSIMGMVGHVQAAAYNASKGAVRIFTKSLALEFAAAGLPIRINSIHPGFIYTPLLDIGMQKAVDEGHAEKAQDLIDGLIQSTPIGRLGQPEEIAGVAAFLASIDSSFMTGSEVVADGGWTAR